MTKRDPHFAYQVALACQEPTLIDALTFIAIWDCNRAVRQAIEHEKAGTREPDGFLYHSMFKRCFKEVLTRWEKEH